jgi:hypothetical protein
MFFRRALELRPALATPFGPRVARLWDNPFQPYRRRIAGSIAGGLVALGLLRLGGQAMEAAGVESHALLRPMSARDATYGFEANRGQADPRVQYLTRSDGFAALLLRREIVFTLSPSATAVAGAPLRLRLEGSSEASRPVATDPLPQTTQYRRGALDEHHTAVPTYGSILYENVYPGIDLRLRESVGALRCSFLVEPGRTPSAIRLTFGPGTRLETPDGQAVDLRGHGRPLRLGPVHAHQRINGSTRPIEARMAVRNQGVEIEVGAYDVRAPLVIDSLFAAVDATKPAGL